MDRYDEMLLKARAEMLGQEPLRKAPPHEKLFSHVWESVVKAPIQMNPEQYAQFQANQQASQQRRDQERQQQTQQRTQSSPQPVDPFGQMNEGASLDQPAPPTGMRANFRQGQQETRDPNRTGMMGRAKQGIGNFMNRFRRQPSQQTESTPPSLQEEQAPPADERAFRDTPRSELPPSFRTWNRYDKQKDPFPTRDWVRDTMEAGGNDLAEWDRMNAIREQRQAEEQQAQQAEQGTDLRQATKDKMTMSPMQEAQEMKTPVDAGLDAMREQPKVDDDFYDRMTEQEEPRFDKPTPPKVEEQREFVDPFGQMNGLEEQQGIDEEFNTEVEGIEPQYMDIDQKDVMKPLEESSVYRDWAEDIEGAGEIPMDSEWQDAPDTLSEMSDEEWGDFGFEPINEQEERLTNPLPTGGKGVKGLLPNRAPKDRQLPENVGDTETGEMVGIGGRKGFNEVNLRDKDTRARQAPGARSPSGRLKEKKRRDADVERRSVDPTEATERVLNPPKPKKASKKKAAKKGPAAKAVETTAKKRKGKAAVEEIQEMQEEAPPKKGAAKVKETTSKAKPKKGAAKVKETTSKKKGPAAKLVEATDEKRKDDSKNIFQGKAKPARERKKNPRKQRLKGASEATQRSRERQKAKRQAGVEEQTEPAEKEYGLSVSGSASKDEISELMEAARNGNKSAQSAVYNNAATLEDAHGISVEDIEEAHGR